jgi:hypothetical protein
MSIRSAAAAALSPFAHLAGLGPRRAATTKATDDKPKDDAPEAEEEEDADQASDTAAEGEGTEAEAEEEAADAEGDGEGEGEDPPEDDPDEEMRGNSAAAQARRRERARCAAIFASPHAAGRADVAAQLAFRTTMPRSAAIESLAALARADGGGGRRRRAGLDERMQGADNPRLNPGGGEKPAAAQVASSWDAAFKRVSR